MADLATITIPDEKLAAFWTAFKAAQNPEDVDGLTTQAQKLAYVRQRAIELLVREYHKGAERIHHGTLSVEEGVVE